MAAFAEGSKILTHFMPSLSHLAEVKVVISFFSDFLKEIKTLERVYEDVQKGISANFNDHKAKRIEEKLLFIPTHLRHKVFETIIGIEKTMRRWTAAHVLINSRQISLYVKSDGTIDRIKTAQNAILNENITIRDRFRLACMYCFEESVLSLWKEMEASDEAKDFETSNSPMMNFWVGWILGGCRDPWLQAIKEYIIPSPLVFSLVDRILMSPFFTLLQPKEREEFLPFLKFTRADDFQFCLCAATREEEVKILEEDAKNFLLRQLHWPLQRVFMEKAKRVWHFLDVSSFYHVLMFIWYLQERKDYDYCQLFVEFWNSCPVNLREAVKGNITASRKIDSILNEIKRKRLSISGTNQNRLD